MAGHEFGQLCRALEGLDSLEKIALRNPSLTCTIQTGNILSLNVSFIEGFFGKSLPGLGPERFELLYQLPERFKFPVSQWLIEKERVKWGFP